MYSRNRNFILIIEARNMLLTRKDSSPESLQTKSQVQTPESIPIPQFPHHPSSSSSSHPPCIPTHTRLCYCSHFHSPSELAGSPSASQVTVPSLFSSLFSIAGSPGCLPKKFCCILSRAAQLFEEMSHRNFRCYLFDYLRKFSCYCEANTLL